MRNYRWTLPLAGVMLVAAAPLAAQTDYRNLDDDRPVRTEDAWPIEFRAWEWLAPVRYARHAGRNAVELTPEVSWGIARNLMVGTKLPFAGNDGLRGLALAGPRLFALYSFNAETRSLPGFAVRADAILPVGPAGGDGALVVAKAIATRTWGRLRTHANASVTVGRAEDAPRGHAPERWSASTALDWSLVRQSTLVIAEVVTGRALVGDGQSWEAAAGIRRQLTPLLVLDFGVSHRLSGATDSDYGVTLGLSRTFSIGTPAPRGTR